MVSLCLFGTEITVQSSMPGTTRFCAVHYAGSGVRAKEVDIRAFDQLLRGNAKLGQ